MGGFPPQMNPPKFKLFTFYARCMKIFRVNKYKEKIKFDKIWGYQNGGSPSNGAKKTSNFLTTYARHIKFSE